MSKFKTSLPVDLESVKKLLPEGVHVHHVEWDEAEQDVNIVWEYDRLLSGFDFPVEFPIENLRLKKLPKGVKLATERATRPPRTPKASKPAEEKEPTPPTEEDIEFREYKAGLELARNGGRIEACESDAARRGFEDASKPEQERAPVETKDESAKKQPSDQTVTTGNSEGAVTAAATESPATQEAPSEAANPEAAPQGAVPTTSDKKVARGKSKK